MNTDTSTFSLEEANSVLAPHLKYLPFTRLHDHINLISQKYVVEGTTFSCSLTSGNVMMPGSVSTNDRVIYFPLNDIILAYSKCHARLLLNGLVYSRSDIGGTYGYWYYFVAYFSSHYKHSLTTLYGDGEKSKICSVKNTEQLTNIDPKNLDIAKIRYRFWSHLFKIIQDTLKERQKIIDNLGILGSQCVYREDERKEDFVGDTLKKL